MARSNRAQPSTNISTPSAKPDFFAMETKSNIDIYDVENYPELAAALGNMVVAWAAAKTALVATLARSTGMTRNRCTIAYYRIPTFEA
jgi:hypothetical protein